VSKRYREGLKMFKFEDNKMYRMPPFFGGNEYIPDFDAHVNDVVSMVLTYTTDGKKLADYLPEGFELLRPELAIGFTQLREVTFMAGGGYNLVEISVPARFNGKHDRLEGSFALVVWENNTVPIIGGREETGVPKIFADIQDLHPFPPKYFTNASFEGNTFLRMEMTGAQPIVGELLEQIRAGSVKRNLLCFRFIPKVGRPGAELAQPVLYPQGSVVKSAWIGSGTVEWTKLRPEQNLSQFRIIEALADLPIISMAPAMMIKGEVIMKPFAGRVLE